VLKRLIEACFVVYLLVSITRWRFHHAVGGLIIWSGMKCQRWLRAEFSHHAFMVVLKWYLWRPAWITDAMVAEAQAKRGVRSDDTTDQNSHTH
jgi:uncharacterized membrane protein